MTTHILELSDTLNLIRNIAADTKSASSVLAGVNEDSINALLCDLAKALREQAPSVISSNQKDMKKGQDRGLSDALLDRLMLDDGRIENMALGVEAIAKLSDPMGRVLWEENRPNGLNIQRVSAPIGVLGMIYEARPNVTIDAAALCLKSRNAVLLRGGSESLHSSLALHAIVQGVLKAHELPEAAVSMVPTNDRDAVGAMLAAADLIDVLIPRGGKGLIERVMKDARMPVFSHLDGICHVYIDASAQPEIAKTVSLNAKMRRTGICGAMETLLLDRALDQKLARDVLAQLIDAGCHLVGDTDIQALDQRIAMACEEDWSTEYLESKLSVRYVDGVDDAIAHINHYGSHHTDSILAEDEIAVSKFQQYVDSGIVIHNASTQFADGGEFGMGAEIGIATGKLHARGPVGLEQLMSYKYIVSGNGQTRPI